MFIVSDVEETVREFLNIKLEREQLYKLKNKVNTILSQLRIIIP